MKYLLAVDLETTGLNPDYNEITEIAAVLLDSDLEIMGKFHSLVNIDYPERGYENVIERDGRRFDVWEMTGINPADLKNAPPFIKVIRNLNKFITGKTGTINKGEICLFGQNVQFDKQFLKKLYLKTNTEWLFDYHTINLESIYTTYYLLKHKTFPDLLTQKSMCEQLNIVNPKSHSAVNDINTSIAIMKYLIREMRK